ncbi:hypothetical protein L6452_03490 [Arctium lappa]|uniref:Uncharacterized protein n=1 Tax=Arctium lappa TaxID=4217 RepID=A0ACB9FND2_ARCLA|nr:hypothetical protein L6452_03490 [Arctium lappa]
MFTFLILHVYVFTVEFCCTLAQKYLRVVIRWIINWLSLQDHVCRSPNLSCSTYCDKICVLITVCSWEGYPETVLTTLCCYNFIGSYRSNCNAYDLQLETASVKQSTSAEHFPRTLCLLPLPLPLPLPSPSRPSPSSAGSGHFSQTFILSQALALIQTLSQSVI